MKKKSTIKNKKTSNENINLIYSIHCKNINVEVNPLIYSEDDEKKIKEIVKCLSANIYIDRTYVKYKGNHFRDAFLIEDKWYEFNKLVIKTDFGRKCGKKINDTIRDTLMAIALTYIYDCLIKYDYDIEEIELSFTPKFRFKVEYKEDLRTDWFF